MAVGSRTLRLKKGPVGDSLATVFGDAAVDQAFAAAGTNWRLDS